MLLLHLTTKSRWKGLKPITDLGNNHAIGKPDNAFWTSPATLKSQWTSDWVRWCDANNFYAKDEPHVGIMLEAPSANIYHIRDRKSYCELSDRFPVEDEYTTRYFIGQSDGLNPIDWTAMAKYYDGVRVTGKALGLSALSAWDVSSVAFFNTGRLTIDRIVDIEFESDPYKVV